MESQLQIINKKLGYVAPYNRIIDGKKYQLFDALYIKDKQQMFDFENRIIPYIKSKNYLYRVVKRKDTLAIYVRRRK